MSLEWRLVQENPSSFLVFIRFLRGKHVIGKAGGSWNWVREKIVGTNQVFVCMRESNHRSLIYARAYIFTHICRNAAGVWPPASYWFPCMCIYLCTLSCRPCSLCSPRIHTYIYIHLLIIEKKMSIIREAIQIQSVKHFVSRSTNVYTISGLFDPEHAARVGW